MRLTYITRNYKDVRSAGGKAKTDIEQIMQAMGAVNLGWSQTRYTNKVVDFCLTFTGVCKALLSLRRDDVLVLQYPVKKYYDFICRTAHRRGAHVITLIHDLGSFRRKKLTTAQELARLNQSNVIIVHNEKMRRLLEEWGCKARLVELGIFDYLSPTPITSTRPLPSGPHSAMFVGSMAADQNRFLYDLGKQLTKTDLYLYGNRYEASLDQSNGRLQPQGFAVDYDLMRSNKGDFGLSWYGESLSMGQGKIGEYMAYNNPHKISLYLRCHLPVILWRNAGLASFVEREGCGLIVDTLEVLEQQLAAITPEQYIEMYDNARRVSQLIADGHYARTAINHALQLLSE